MKSPLRILLALGIGAIGSTVGQARIGETEKQCKERYGQPEETYPERSTQTYRKGDVAVLAHFHEGKCDYIIFRKIEGDELKEFSENERDLLLKANGDGKEWKKTATLGGMVVFETTGGEFRAQHNRSSHSLAIFSRDAVKRKQDEKAAEEEKKLKGF